MGSPCLTRRSRGTAKSCAFGSLRFAPAAPHLYVMPQPDFPEHQTPRYFRASIGATLATAVLPSLFVILGLNTAIEASEAQGVVLMLLIGGFSVCFTAIAFPLSAMYLHRHGHLRQSKFNSLLFRSLAIISILFCLFISFAVIGSSDFVFMAPLLFVASCILSLPFRSLWYRLAQ